MRAIYSEIVPRQDTTGDSRYKYHKWKDLQIEWKIIYGVQWLKLYIDWTVSWLRVHSITERTDALDLIVRLLEVLA